MSRAWKDAGSGRDEDDVPTLREPKGAFQELVRKLAEQAMAVTHHDASDTEPGYVREVQSMERAFTRTLRGFLSARTRAGRTSPEGRTPEDERDRELQELRKRDAAREAAGLTLEPVADGDGSWHYRIVAREARPDVEAMESAAPETGRRP